MAEVEYHDIVVDIIGQIGIIKFNRPKSLNSFGGKLVEETIQALRDLNSNPNTAITVLTGEGRFFSAGADIRGGSSYPTGSFANSAEKKLAYTSRYVPHTELVRSIIEHKKVFVLALNGPAVGGGAAWFLGLADIIVAVDSAYLQIPFSALGLVPENGSITNISQSIGVQRANEFLIFGRKLTAQELQQWGLITKIFPTAGFHDSVRAYLQQQLDVNDGQSMMIAKQLQNAPLRSKRLLSLYDSADALAERGVSDRPLERFAIKIAELEEKSKLKARKAHL